MALKTSSTFEKTFLQWPHTWTWAFTVYEWFPGSRFPLYANNLLHVSHLKGFIFRWTLFIWQGRSSDMAGTVLITPWTTEGNEVQIQSLWCFLWRTRFSFCTYNSPHSGQTACSSAGFFFLFFFFFFFCGAEVINGWPVVHFHLGRDIHYIPLRHCGHLHL